MRESIENEHAATRQSGVRVAVRVPAASQSADDLHEKLLARASARNTAGVKTIDPLHAMLLARAARALSKR